MSLLPENRSDLGEAKLCKSLEAICNFQSANHIPSGGRKAHS